MRYSASDKTEIIRLVEQSPLSARRTLWKLGIPRSLFLTALHPWTSSVFRRSRLFTTASRPTTGGARAGGAGYCSTPPRMELPRTAVEDRAGRLGRRPGRGGSDQAAG